MSQAYVVNGVVISDDGNIVRYRTRCPRCGDVDQSSIRSSACREGAIVNVGITPCTKCSNLDRRTYTFEIQVRRGY